MNVSMIVDNRNTRRSGPFSLKSLFANFPEKIAAKGTILLKRNYSLGYIFFLEEGIIKTASYYPAKEKEILDGYYTPGELMNLENWNKNQIQPPTLKVASAKARFKVIPVHEFRKLVLQNQGLSQLVLQTMNERLIKNKERLHRLLLGKSRQRVVQFLLDYVSEIGQRVGYEYVIKKPFTHEEMGNLSDTSRQTVTTVLNELKAANIIHFTRRYIVIRNLEALNLEAKKED